MPNRPNIVVILADDMGFSDIGCYGGEIRTPNLDRLAEHGVRFSQFYNTARCSPSRASLMTGLHPHQTGIGILTFDDSPDGYSGTLNDRCVTLPEVLGDAGYHTYMSGKWHMTNDATNPSDSWPTRRGFDKFYGTLDGGGSYFQPHTLFRGEEPVDVSQDADFYYTDRISDQAVEFIEDHRMNNSNPFFLYVAYTAPHWPLHAPREAIDRYLGRFDAGWDELRRQRTRRLIDEGIIDASWAASDRDPEVPAWHDVANHEWEAYRMAVYAAQVDIMDQGIGRIVSALDQTESLDNTLFIFLSDNGACAESPLEFVPEFLAIHETTRDGTPVVAGNSPELFPGPDSTYASYGRAWANLSNTPFREYKHWVHEGGIATPMVVHWPEGLPESSAGVIRHRPHQLPDIMATVLDVTGVQYPHEFHGREISPLEGRSMLPSLIGQVDQDADRFLFWEHEGNAAVRRGRWKLVRRYPGNWELYDMYSDRAELRDRAVEQPTIVRELSEAYDAWAKRCGVLPREQILDLYRRRGHGLPT